MKSYKEFTWIRSIAYEVKFSLIAILVQNFYRKDSILSVLIKSLGLVLSLLLCCSISLASFGSLGSVLAESDVKPPLQQIKDGVAIEDIRCNDGHVLVLRDNGIPACVTKNTAERTGWPLIEPKPVTDEPKPVTDEPKPVTDEPKPVTDEPKPVTDEPKPVTDELEPKTLDLSSDKEFVVDEPDEQLINENATDDLKSDGCSDAEPSCGITPSDEKSTVQDQPPAQDSLPDNAGKKNEPVHLASYAESKIWFSKDFIFYRDAGWVDTSHPKWSSTLYFEYSERLGRHALVYDEDVVAFQKGSLMYAQTDKKEYHHGDVIHISGRIADVVTIPHGYWVSAFVRTDDGGDPRFTAHASGEVNPDGSYELEIDTSSSKWFYEGTHVVKVSHGIGMINDSMEIELLTGFKPTTRSIGPDDVVLDLSSTTEFVHDGRQYPHSLSNRGHGVIMYHTILESYADFYVDADGVAFFTPTPHEKYSLNPDVGFYVEDWIPQHIPEGYKLLYVDTACYPSGDCGLKIVFMPSTFVLTPLTKNINLQISNGLFIRVSYFAEQLDEIEDRIEHFLDYMESKTGSYGGFEDITRDGKTVWAYQGGNKYHHHTASISYDIDDHTTLSVRSEYHTLDELIPIFNSVVP